MPRIEVRADQLFLAAEGVVQRRLGDARALDHAVDPDGVHALLVEELARRLQQALTGGRTRRLVVGHGA